MRNRLLDVDRATQAPTTDCTELILFGSESCLRCRSEVTEVKIDQPALLRHGGYGATQRTVVRECTKCRFTFVVEVSEISPRRKAS